MNMKVPKANSKSQPPGMLMVGLLAIVLCLFFWRSFLPDFVHFSNDGPLGQQHGEWGHLPEAFTGSWNPSSVIGGSNGVFPLGVDALLKWLVGPVGFAKFLAPIALFMLGLGAWAFFRQLKFTPLATLLGTLATMFNSTFFATACWGVASQQIALGMDFFALALVVANTKETAWHIRWTRLALAGLCVGLNVIEAADIGALYSILVAAFVIYKSWTERDGGNFKRVIRGASHVAVIAVFAGFIAFQTVVTLLGTSIQGVAGVGQDTETKSQHWDWATQWSLPKKETLSLLVPGLFGYKMDTPKDMMPELLFVPIAKAYQGGVYWGGIGRDPRLDQFLDAGGQGAPPSGFMRFTGGTNYCGILVLLIAAWGLAQSFRRQNSPFSEAQKKLIWFWAVVAAICLPLAWGRFAPGSHSSNDVLFYAFLYKLPYFSTIRNPVKFLIFFSWAVVILFAYGVHALNRRHPDGTTPTFAGYSDQLKSWWARAGAFDRKWTQVCLGLLGASLLGWLIYSAQKPSLIQYLQKTGFPDEAWAQQIATFSISQTGWFLLLFAGAFVLVTLTIAGCFTGPRTKIGAVLLGGFILFDLGRADLPYVVHWDYKQKYEVGSLNPILELLAQKPYEHRVAGLPFHAPPGLELLDELYRIEWMQHQFPYYNIQCVEPWQMPRVAADLKAYLETLTPHSSDTIRLYARHWQLTNTRYLLGVAGYIESLNQQLDPVQKRFRIVQRFGIALKPGVTEFHQRLEELTAYPNDNGDYALFEFTGALPRAKLYCNWQVNTNDEANLKTLADPNFDPAKTVLVSTPQKNLPAFATNENSGTVEIKSYSPKKIVLTANAAAPSILLFNDKYDPDWRVTVDGHPAALLRCNFIMRGIQLAPGAHEVKFDYSLPSKPLYVTVSAFGLGVLLCGFLLAFRGKPDDQAEA